MGRRSAIKVMNPSMVHDPDAVARFNREAANASRITHPHVCAIYDFGETPDGLIYLAMEFIEGEPLTDLLHRDGVLSIQRAARIFFQTADALQAAHDLGIVHRDLKPDNIMVSRGRDMGDVVKVVDFGIAKAVGGDDAGQKVTKTGLVVGTPEFMSPEQLAGDAVDGRSDLYALALVFFRMVTGRLPFEAETVQETMIKRLTDEPTKLATVRPDLSFPPGLQAVLDTALTRSPVDRYQTVAKFAEDLKSVTGMGAGSAGTRAVPVTRAGSEGATQLLDTAATKQIGARRSATPAAPRKRALVPVAIGAVVVLGGAGAGVLLLGGSKKGETGAGVDTTQGAGNVAIDTPRTRQTNNPPPAPPLPPPPPADPGRGANTRPRLDLARIPAALNELFAKVDEKTLDARVARDSAQAIFDERSVPAKDRAFAAYIVATAYAQLSDQSSACRWARNAVTTFSAEEYTILERDLCKP
jgi:serine/threonine-protein kinase